MRDATPSPVRQAIGRCRTGFLAIACFSIIVNLLILTSPIYMMQVFDRVLASGHIETLFYLTLIAATAVAAMSLVDVARITLASRIGAWVDGGLGAAILSRTVELGARGPIGGGRPAAELAKIRAFTGGSAIYPMLDAPWMPVFLIILWLMHPWIGLMGLITAAVMFSLAILSEVVGRSPLADAVGHQNRASDIQDAVTRNVDVVRSMGMLPGLLSRWEASTNESLSLQMKASDRSAWIIGCTKFIRMFAQIAILGLGAWLVLAGELSSGGMIAASILLGRALSPVEQAIGSWKSFIAARQGKAALDAFFSGFQEGMEPTPLPTPAGRIAVERVGWAPVGAERPIIGDVSFSLSPGQALGIIGPSAAGKSTLCRLLVGSLSPIRGSVRLDGAEFGIWRSGQLAKAIGYLPQDVELFSGTVGENIARMAARPDHEAILQAANLAGAHNMILRLPRGYDTVIGASGATLSGGQKQRIGLARALYGKPRLIVLDEPNANLDADGEEALRNAILAMKGEGSTIIVSAHRPSILGATDLIMVMREGAVFKMGPREEIIQTPARRPSSIGGTGTAHATFSPPLVAAVG